MGAFKKRLEALLPKIKQAMASGGPSAQDVKTKVAEAGALANKKDFARASGLLDAIEALLKTPGSASQPGRPASSLKIWQQAKDSVDAQLNTLYATLKGSKIPQVIEAANEIEAVMGNYRTKLVAALTVYDTTTGPAKEKARADALKVVAAYQTGIPKDKHIIAADTNPFGVKVAIRQTLGSALTDLTTNLRA
jgi:hypothetical protein